MITIARWARGAFSYRSLGRLKARAFQSKKRTHVEARRRKAVRNQSMVKQALELKRTWKRPGQRQRSTSRMGETS